MVKQTRVRVNIRTRYVLDKVKERDGGSFESIVWFMAGLVYPELSAEANKEFEVNAFAGDVE